MSAHAPWWRGATVYQIYIRSFCDGDGDGNGDLSGLVSKLDYVASLGVDAIWLSPIHPSPDRDWGYDVSDFEGVHPDYGSEADFTALINEAHARGLKIILDEVLCHTSDEHAWFAASRDGVASKANWYVWADPKDDGTAPNNWLSVFGGPAWSYQPARRQYYHHKFLRQQPKLNWTDANAREAALKVLDFWLERGVDGYRLDVANGYLHDVTLQDNPAIPARARQNVEWSAAANMQRHFHDSNREENREILDLIRRRVEAYGSRFVFGEFSEEFERSGCYLSPRQGLHAGYNFALLVAQNAQAIAAHLQILAAFADHWPCVAFSNHDVVRTVSRFAGSEAGDPGLAKVMLALLFALRGTVLVYQGEELGLPQVDLPRRQLKDPVGDLYYPVFKGRDGSRTPMPWQREEPNLGFTSGSPWLPLGRSHADLAVSVQERDANSPLAYTRMMIQARKSRPALRHGMLALISTTPLAFVRSLSGQQILCVFNLSGEQIDYSLPVAARALDFGTGNAELHGRRLSLAGFTAWFGAF